MRQPMRMRARSQTRRRVTKPLMCRPPRVAESFYAGRRCSIYIVVCTLDTQRNSFRLSQSVSYFTVPPRAHPSTGSQSGSATPGLTQVTRSSYIKPEPERARRPVTRTGSQYKIDQNSLGIPSMCVCAICQCLWGTTQDIADRVSRHIESIQQSARIRHHHSITTATVYSLALGAGLATPGATQYLKTTPTML